MHRSFLMRHHLSIGSILIHLISACQLNDKGEEQNVLAIGVGEIKPELGQWESAIQDLKLPSGMGEFDTAAFTDRYTYKKEWIRLRIRAVHTIKERIKTRCLNYAIRIERQLQAQEKTESFLQESHNEVNNYFKAYSEDVYAKLQKAAQLVDSSETEDYSLLLTQVRRAIKAAADFFYPPKVDPVICSDGKKRILVMNTILESYTGVPLDNI